MYRRDNIFKEKNGYMKVLIIMKIACSVTVLILVLTQLIGIWDKAIYISQPLLGIVNTSMLAFELLPVQSLYKWENR